jgi:hypothetical protein
MFSYDTYANIVTFAGSLEEKREGQDWRRVRRRLERVQHLKIAFEKALK